MYSTLHGVCCWKVWSCNIWRRRSADNSCDQITDRHFLVVGAMMQLVFYNCLHFSSLQVCSMVVILRHNTFVYIDSFDHGGGFASKLCLFPANVVVFSARTFVKSILLVLTVDQNAVLPLVGTFVCCSWQHHWSTACYCLHLFISEQYTRGNNYHTSLIHFHRTVQNTDLYLKMDMGNIIIIHNLKYLFK